MNISYIFLLKNKKREKFVNKEIENNILKVLFNNVKDSSFEVYIDKKKYDISYMIFYDKNLEMIELTLSHGKKRINDAKVLNHVDNLLRKGKLRKDYSIIVTYDGVSSYFCNKAYPMINEFETCLRELVYTILIKTFGIEWYEKTVSDELSSRIKQVSKGKSNSALIESALNEMTMHDLETYLFKPYSEFDFEQLVKSEQNIDAIFSEKSKEEIVLLLEKCIPKSLWNRFFDSNIDDIQNELNMIRDFRNKVAHNKEFNENEYNNFCNIVKMVISKIKNAKDNISMKEFNSQIINDSYYAYSTIGVERALQQLGEHAKLMQKALDNTGMKRAMEQLGEHSKLIQKALDNTGMKRAMEQLGEHSKLMQKALDNTGMRRAMEQLGEHSKLMQKALDNTGMKREVEQSGESSKLIQKEISDSVIENKIGD